MASLKYKRETLRMDIYMRPFAIALRCRCQKKNKIILTFATATACFMNVGYGVINLVTPEILK